jgi:hypothetical protein
VDGPINERIDDAYRAKYHDSSYLRPMIGARARSATLMVTLREIGAWTFPRSAVCRLKGLQVLKNYRDEVVNSQ